MPASFNAVSARPAFLETEGNKENPLEAIRSELAGLRFSIILTARWEAGAGGDVERRKALRGELKELRRQYAQKIDAIAMTFGVQAAMDAKEEVERTIAIPLNMDLRIEPREDGSDPI